ncbi:MAG: hypothetical protein CL908_14845 [Deltaproteobacteria bacterium]|nr:hypothetical protein [Deltaproteobacteria bacterium]
MCAGALVTPAILQLRFDELFPAPIGPHFAGVPDDGRAYVVPRARAFLEMADGRQIDVRLTKMLGIKALERELVRLWLEGRMQSPAAKRWLRETIHQRQEWRTARALVLQWHEQRVNKRTLAREEPALVAESRWEL